MERKVLSRRREYFSLRNPCSRLHQARYKGVDPLAGAKNVLFM